VHEPNTPVIERYQYKTDADDAPPGEALGEVEREQIEALKG
jgi:hypothetical protein